MLVSCFVFSSSLNAVLKWVVHWSLTDHLQWLSLGWLLQSLVNTLVQSFEPDMQCTILKDSLVVFETRIVWSDLTVSALFWEIGVRVRRMKYGGVRFLDQFSYSSCNSNFCSCYNFLCNQVIVEKSWITFIPFLVDAIKTLGFCG